MYVFGIQYYSIAMIDSIIHYKHIIVSVSQKYDFFENSVIIKKYFRSTRTNSFGMGQSAPACHHLSSFKVL